MKRMQSSWMLIWVWTLALSPAVQADWTSFTGAELSSTVAEMWIHPSHITLRLDWTDPWYSAFENPTLKRHHRAPLMTFLYIEPYEVRFEILMRLKELASWMAIDLVRGSDHLEANRKCVENYCSGPHGRATLTLNT